MATESPVVTLVYRDDGTFTGTDADAETESPVVTKTEPKVSWCASVYSKDLRDGMKAIQSFRPKEKTTWVVLEPSENASMVISAGEDASVRISATLSVNLAYRVGVDWRILQEMANIISESDGMVELEVGEPSAYTGYAEIKGKYATGKFSLLGGQPSWSAMPVSNENMRRIGAGITVSTQVLREMVKYTYRMLPVADNSSRLPIPKQVQVEFDPENESLTAICSNSMCLGVAKTHAYSEDAGKGWEVSVDPVLLAGIVQAAHSLSADEVSLTANANVLEACMLGHRGMLAAIEVVNNATYIDWQPMVLAQAQGTSDSLSESEGQAQFEAMISLVTHNDSRPRNTIAAGKSVWSDKLLRFTIGDKDELVVDLSESGEKLTSMSIETDSIAGELPDGGVLLNSNFFQRAVGPLPMAYVNKVSLRYREIEIEEKGNMGLVQLDTEGRECLVSYVIATRRSA